MKVIVEPLTLRTDGRGSVFEPLDPGGLCGQRNAHVVLTEPGRVRGNHYHLRGTEVLVVCGPALVRYREGGELVDVPVGEGEAVRFTIPPRVPHAIKHTGTRPGLLVAFNTVEHDPAAPDVVREVLIEG